ncbi:MAG TPA: hypothetical protein VGN12_00290 [Pirellulales bacterium]|jgi:hypothetical protein
MSEVWLHTNRRAILFALIFPVFGLICGILLLLLASPTMLWARYLGIAVTTAAVLLTIAFVLQLRQPRIALRGDEVLFYMRSGPPFRVPLPLVEGFLMGQGASYLRKDEPSASQVSTVVIRLADRATDYAQREVKPALGSWCNHYVTIRGTWCEPLSLALVTRLNTRLAEAQANLKATQAQ